VRNGLASGRSKVLLGTAVFFASCIHARALPVPDALSRALHGTQASAVVLDPRTGAVLASAGGPRRGPPGSTVKPLLLEYALEHDIVRPETEVYCRRDLHVGNRALPCTHPADHPVFTAESALAESCNTWFAEMARRFTGPALEMALKESHLPHGSLNAANVEQRQLAVLGLQGVSASPLELARAYRDLLERAPPTGPVVRGLQDSVSYGMANPAAVAGVTILGKTGTASSPGETWTHGWFAGAIPGRFLLVVYVPHGDGGAAARLAQKFFQTVAPEGQPR
jgi:cell division protein FtsI/penicillin-binding protein 2